jgi:hypothetical protein
MAKHGNLTAMQAYSRAVAVTPNDDTVLSATDALWVGDGNTNMTVLMANGSSATFNAIPDGTLLYVSVTKVTDTDTDAANIVALYY